jgi:adenylate cyclase
LPAEIAERLKESHDEVIADAYDEISVLFADIVGFTPLSAELPPEEMVRLLNDVFRHFDDLVAHYGVEKIRTIGDNYMVAAGVPRPRADHAQVLARLALDMNAYVATLPGKNGQRLQFRISMNSGPAIAGVIGQSKFHYDIWGDAVNMASRMESHGVPGKIQITPQMMRLIEDAFICRKRGVIDVKGKGLMETWFVEGLAEPVWRSL